jgi:hypothetical protein
MLRRVEHDRSRVFRSLSLVVLARPGSPLKEPGMPYLLIQTNQGIGEEEQSRLVTEASKIVATTLNKPEKYVMVAWNPDDF